MNARFATPYARRGALIRRGVYVYSRWKLYIRRNFCCANYYIAYFKNKLKQKKNFFCGYIRRVRRRAITLPGQLKKVVRGGKGMRRVEIHREIEKAAKLLNCVHQL